MQATRATRHEIFMHQLARRGVTLPRKINSPLAATFVGAAAILIGIACTIG